MDNNIIYIENVVTAVIVVFVILIVFCITVTVFLTTFKKSGKNKEEKVNSENDVPFSC